MSAIDSHSHRRKSVDRLIKPKYQKTNSQKIANNK